MTRNRQKMEGRMKAVIFPEAGGQERAKQTTPARGAGGRENRARLGNRIVTVAIAEESLAAEALRPADGKAGAPDLAGIFENCGLRGEGLLCVAPAADAAAA